MTSRKRIAEVLKRRKPETVRRLLNDIADAADDAATEAIKYYEAGNGVFAGLQVNKARGMLTLLDEAIQRLLKEEHDAEND